MVALELEVMAKKMDRFGWENDRGSAAHDRIVSDWMAALQDYPLEEVQEACRMHVAAHSRKMPNEGDIVAQLRKLRKVKADKFKAVNPQPEQPKPAPCSPDAAAEIMARAGFGPKRMEAAE